MQTVVYIPKQCGERILEDGTKAAPTFKGSITLKVPDYFERQELKELLMMAIVKDGETSVEAIKAGQNGVDIMKMLKRLRDLARACVPYYQAVEIENLRTGKFHKSFEDLGRDPDAEAMIQEIGQELAGGLSLSKNS